MTFGARPSCVLGQRVSWRAETMASAQWDKPSRQDAASGIEFVVGMNLLRCPNIMDNIFVEGLNNPGLGKSPTTAEAYANTVRRSGLIDEQDLDDALHRFETNPDRDKRRNGAEQLALFLLGEKLLTPWQTKMLMGGRWRGFVLGKYRLLDRIGSGGMSSVYLAEHQLMRRRVAIKVLPRMSHEKDTRLNRFLNESRLVAQLDHPHIVRAFHLDAEADRYYLVMEYVEGLNLQQKVEREGPLPFETAADYICQAARGLAHAHTHGLVHRDVKPANILVDHTDTVKLLDLGLARSTSPDATSYTTDRTGKVLGTADYVAPEQVKDSHDVDARTDIYSLGCTFYYLLTGQPPFADGNLAQKLAMHLYHQPTSIRELRPDTPLALVRACHKMMGKRREDRFQTATEIVEVLTQWLKGRTKPPAYQQPAPDTISEPTKPTVNLPDSTGLEPPKFDNTQTPDDPSPVVAPIATDQGPEITLSVQDQSSDLQGHPPTTQVSEDRLSAGLAQDPAEAQNAQGKPDDAGGLKVDSGRTDSGRTDSGLTDSGPSAESLAGAGSSGPDELSQLSVGLLSQGPTDQAIHKQPQPVQDELASLAQLESPEQLEAPSAASESTPRANGGANAESELGADLASNAEESTSRTRGEPREKRTRKGKKKTRRPTPPKVMTLEQLAEYLQMPAESLEPLATAGQIPCQRILGELRFHRDAIDKWFESNFDGGLAQTGPTTRSSGEERAAVGPTRGYPGSGGSESWSGPSSGAASTSSPAPAPNQAAPATGSSYGNRFPQRPAEEPMAPPVEQAPGYPLPADLSAYDTAAVLAELGLLPSAVESAFRKALASGQLPNGDALLTWARQRGWLTDHQLAVLRQGRNHELRYGEYLVLDRLGAGGMAEVFKARRDGSDQIVALKVLRRHPGDQPGEEAQRFDREVRAVAKLNHPNIVAAYDACHDGTSSYLVLEYVDGVNLDQQVRREGPLPVAEAVDYIMQAAQGLVHAHAQHLVHRDVKPGNLLVDTRGVVKILDLGLVRFESHALAGTLHSDVSQPLTTRDTVLGTPDFMAPEQFADARQADNRADIYSLGCTLYFLLTGRGPYERDSPTKTLQAHQTQPTPSLQAACPDAPATLELVFKKMLAKEPRQRYQSMEEVVADLNRYVVPRVGLSPATNRHNRPTPKTAPPTISEEGTLTESRTASLGEKATRASRNKPRTLIEPVNRSASALPLGGGIGLLGGGLLGWLASLLPLSENLDLRPLLSWQPLTLSPGLAWAIIGAIAGGAVGLVVARLLTEND